MLKGISIKNGASRAKMETVRVNFYSWAAETLGEEAEGGEVTIEAPLPPQGTLQGLLEGLAEHYPLFGREIYDTASAQINQRVTLFLNGRSIILSQALQTKLKGGDLLALVPLTEGG